VNGKHVFCHLSRCVICWLCLSESRLCSPQREMAWVCYKSPNGCSWGRVSEVCYKEGSDVAPMGTESATVLWSRHVSGRIKNTKEFARPCKNHYAILDRAVAGSCRTAFFIQMQVLQLWCCIGTFRPRKSYYRERTGQHLNQRFLTVLDSTSSVSQRWPSRTPWSKSETFHTAVCQSGTSP
jgi:hypothetical protein